MQARRDRRSSCSAEMFFACAPSWVCLVFVIQGSPLRFSMFMRAMLFPSFVGSAAALHRNGREGRNGWLFGFRGSWNFFRQLFFLALLCWRIRLVGYGHKSGNAACVLGSNLPGNLFQLV